jgi:hypothetical protein
MQKQVDTMTALVRETHRGKGWTEAAVGGPGLRELK